MRLLMQFSACLGLGLVVAVMILIGLMFFGWLSPTAHREAETAKAHRG